MALKDKVEETGAQALLISHHPEYINSLARTMRFSSSA
jgi:hypothetical protein